MDKLYINDTLCDLGNNTTIALTLQIFDVSNLETRNGNFTNTFKLPITPTNKQIFECADVVNSSTDIPYTKVAVKYVKDGIEIIVNGYGILESTDKDYNLTVYSDNSDLFEKLSNESLRTLDLSAYNHKWQRSEMIAYMSDNSTVCYPIVDYGDSKKFDDPYISAYTLLPAINIKMLLGMIFTASGINYTSSELIDFENMLLCHSGDEFENESDFNAQYNTETVNVQPPQQTALASFIINLVDTTYISSNVYTAPINGQYTHKVSGYFEITNIAPPGGTVLVKIDLYKNSVNIASSEVYTASRNVPFYMNFEYTGNAETGDDYEIYYNVFDNWDSVNDVMNIYDLIYDIEMRDIIIKGSMINMSDQVPDIPMRDFVKNCFNMFGIIPIYSTKDSILTIHKLSEINTHKSAAKDWSDKYILMESDKYLLGDYAQNNYLKYNNSNDDETLSDYDYSDTLTIVNTSLPVNKDVIELEFSASNQDVYVDGKTMPKIPLMDTAPTGTFRPVLEFDCGIRVLSSSIETFTINLREYKSSGTSTSITDIVMGKFDDVIDWGTLSDNYSVIQNMMNQTKKLICLFDLKTLDIYQFDHLTPIFVRQLGGYFYVNKIENWKKGQLTKVELIRI